jgi:hypothetical protein
MAKHGRNFVPFVTAISLSVVLFTAAPASANPGAAGEELQGVVDFLRDATNGLLDVLGLRGNGSPPPEAASRAASGCVPASPTASGDCPSASRVASSGGVVTASTPITPAVQTPTATAARLAFTGPLTGELTALAALLMIAGASLVWLGRPRVAPRIVSGG